MDCGPPGCSVHGDSPGKNTRVSCHAFLQGSSQPRDQTQVSWIAGRFFIIWASYLLVRDKYKLSDEASSIFSKNLCEELRGFFQAHSHINNSKITCLALMCVSPKLMYYLFIWFWTWGRKESLLLQVTPCESHYEQMQPRKMLLYWQVLPRHFLNLYE